MAAARTTTLEEDDQMANPFEDDNCEYLVLVNSNGQHSLWPDFVSVPDGWQTAYRGRRAACLGYVEENWRDIRPSTERSGHRR